MAVRMDKLLTLRTATLLRNIWTIIHVIKQDTQYLMINFIHNIQELSMFWTSIVHLQERSYAACRKYCVSCWITYILQNDTHCILYQITSRP